MCSTRKNVVSICAIVLETFFSPIVTRLYVSNYDWLASTNVCRSLRKIRLFSGFKKHCHESTVFQSNCPNIKCHTHHYRGSGVVAWWQTANMTKSMHTFLCVNSPSLVHLLCGNPWCHIPEQCNLCIVSATLGVLQWLYYFSSQQLKTRALDFWHAHTQTHIHHIYDEYTF
jgi:hypothetical protein